MLVKEREFVNKVDTFYDSIINPSKIYGELTKIMDNHRQAGEMANRYLRGMFEMNRGNLEGMLADVSENYEDYGFGEGNGRAINTYPFGKESNILSNDFLGICTGKTRLDHTFAAADRFCRRHCMEKNYEGEQLSVVIFTDKWDIKSFKKYQERFLKYEMKMDLDIVMVLVTDFGITEIPVFNTGNIRHEINCRLY